MAPNQSTPIPATGSSPGLLHLPAELRLQIYELAFAQLDISWPKEPAILSASKTVRNETMKFYYSDLLVRQTYLRGVLECVEQDFEGLCMDGDPSAMDYKWKVDESREELKRLRRFVDWKGARLRGHGYPIGEWMG